jgi:hypothetical protein
MHMVAAAAAYSKPQCNALEQSYMSIAAALSVSLCSAAIYITSLLLVHAVQQHAQFSSASMTTIHRLQNY